jgi:hypothetical protein
VGGARSIAGRSGHSSVIVRRRIDPGRIGHRIAVLLALFVPAACTTPAPTPRDPSLSGVVAAVHAIGTEQTMRFELIDGRTIDIDLAVVRGLYQGGTSPGVGDVLLYGSQPDLTWFVGVSRVPDGSYRLQSRSLTVDARRMTLDSGLRLPIAPDFRPGPGRLEGDAPHTIVINGQGEVTSST